MSQRTKLLSTPWWSHPLLLGTTFPVVLVVLATTTLFGAAVQSEINRNPFLRVAASTDVAYLEELVVSYEAASRQPVPGGLRGKPKTLRTAAFARLGELGTEESLAAVRRIEAWARHVVPAPPIVPMGVWTHPAWHFGDSNVEGPRVRAEGDDGITYGIVVSSMLGYVDLFLVANATPDDPRTWSRPKLIPLRYYRGFREPALEAAGEGKLLLRWVQNEPPPRAIMEGTQEVGEAAPELGEQERLLDIAEIERDSDRDGWTDLEEARLGLDARDADSDGDGVIDGRDVTPNFAPPAELADDLEAQLIAKALFATYGLSGSRYALLAPEDRTHIDVWGYAGPVIFDVDQAAWQAEMDYGAVWVGWSVEKVEGDSATVALYDYEGPLAAGGQQVDLRRIDGEWYVVGWRRGPIA